MSQSAPADQISLLLAGYVLGTLDDAEAETFAQLVIADPALIEKVDQMQQALEEAYSLPEMAPPPQLREKVMAAVATDEKSVTLQTASSDLARPEPASQPATLVPTFEQRPSRQLKAVAIALFAALGLSAFFNYMMWRSLNQQVATAPVLPQQEQIPEIPSSLVYSLSSTNLSQPGTAKVSVDPGTLTAELETSQLPDISPNEVYVLWTVLVPEAPFTTDQKGAILTTTFQVDEQGNTRKTLSAPAVFQQPELIAALGITVEPAGSPQSHTGAPLLLSPI